MFTEWHPILFLKTRLHAPIVVPMKSKTQALLFKLNIMTLKEDRQKESPKDIVW